MAFLRAWWPVLVVAVALFAGLMAFPYAVNALVANADPDELAKQGQYGDLFGMLASALNVSALLLTFVVVRSQVAEDKAARDAVNAQIEAARATENSPGNQVAMPANALATALPELEKRVPEKAANEQQRANRNAAKTVLDATVKDLNSGIAAVRQVQARIEASLAEARS